MDTGIVSFKLIGVKNFTESMQEKTPSFRKCTLKFLGVRTHNICNLLPSGSEKQIVGDIHMERERTQIDKAANRVRD